MSMYTCMASFAIEHVWVGALPFNTLFIYLFFQCRCYLKIQAIFWSRVILWAISTCFFFYNLNVILSLFSQVTNDMDSIQRKYRCCGALNSGDYTTPGKTVPNSCCVNNDCSQGTYSMGCVELAYEDEIWEELKIMIYVSLAQGALEIVTLMLCCCLCREDEQTDLEPDSSKLGLAKAYEDSNLGHGRGYLVAQNQAEKAVTFQGGHPTPTATPVPSNIGGPTSVYVVSPAPNDPIFYQDHMKRHYPQHPKYQNHRAPSDLSSTGAVFQAQHGAPPLVDNSPRNRESLGESLNHNGGLLHQSGMGPVDYEVLSYQHHMKRFPPSNSMDFSAE